LTCLRSLRGGIQFVLKIMQSRQVAVAVIHDDLNLAALDDIVRQLRVVERESEKDTTMGISERRFIRLRLVRLQLLFSKKFAFKMCETER
jgi:hypothetical protein